MLLVIYDQKTEKAWFAYSALLRQHRFRRRAVAVDAGELTGLELEAISSLPITVSGTSPSSYAWRLYTCPSGSKSPKSLITQADEEIV